MRPPNIGLVAPSLLLTHAAGPAPAEFGKGPQSTPIGDAGPASPQTIRLLSVLARLRSPYTDAEADMDAAPPAPPFPSEPINMRSAAELSMGPSAIEDPPLAAAAEGEMVVRRAGPAAAPYVKVWDRVRRAAEASRRAATLVNGATTGAATPVVGRCGVVVLTAEFPRGTPRSSGGGAA